MNAIELYHQDGTSAGVFYCAECRRVDSHDGAESCCRPNVCACGAECPRGWLSCFLCRAAQLRERESVAFDAAKKQCIDDYGGRLVFVGDDRYMSIDALEDYANELLAEFIQDGGHPWEWSPPRVYATHETQPMIDVDGAIECALEDAYEDAERDVSPEAIADLTATVDAWSRAHLPIVYHQDEKLALVPWSC